ncbi:major allergen I polypeptide chain 1-like, partial [Hyaena hyaena]|uniref:major allergen I polypeptide chain 1-like n=1 Tax=Hyaena hyaena TaxID=95912 RepID=UPI0019212CB5
PRPTRRPKRALPVAVHWPKQPTADCEICPAVKRDVDLFLNGTVDEYVEEVAKYNSEPAVLANARNLKNCIDTKLTEEDKEHVFSVLEKIYQHPLC